MASVFDTLGTTGDTSKYTNANAALRAKLKVGKKTAHKAKGKARTKSLSENNKLRKQISSNRAKANPIDPETGTPVRDVENTARSATRGKFESTLKNITGQVSGQQDLIKNLPGYEAQYQKQLGDLAAAQAGQANAVAQSLQTAQAGMQTQDAANQATLQQRAGDSQFSQGAVQAASDASKGRQAMTDSTAANIKAGGEIRSTATKGIAAAETKGAQERSGAAQSKLDRLLQDQNDTTQAIGEYFNASKSDTLSGIADRQVKAAAAKASNDVAKMNAQTNQQKANDTATNQRGTRRIAAGNLGERTRHDKALERYKAANKKKGSGVGSLGAKESTYADDLTSATGKVKTWRAQGWSDKDINDALKGAGLIPGATGLNKHNSNLSEVVLHAANGKLTSGDIKRLHKAGLHLPKDWQPLYKKK